MLPPAAASERVSCRHAAAADELLPAPLPIIIAATPCHCYAFYAAVFQILPPYAADRYARAAATRRAMLRYARRCYYFRFFICAAATQLALATLRHMKRTYGLRFQPYTLLLTHAVFRAAISRLRRRC